MFLEIEKSNSLISAHARVQKLWGRHSFVTTLYLIHFDSMVPFPWVLVDWRLLLWKNGHLEYWMHTFLALYSISTVSGKKLGWPNIYHFFNFRITQCQLNLWVYKKNEKSSCWLLGYFRNRPINVDSGCSLRFSKPIEENVSFGSLEKNRCKISFKSSFLLFINWVKEI